jgi:hypothetical protein
LNCFVCETENSSIAAASSGCQRSAFLPAPWTPPQAPTWNSWKKCGFVVFRSAFLFLAICPPPSPPPPPHPRAHPQPPPRPPPLPPPWQVLSLIECHGIPAPSPIEQRWTANSDSCMSPACATDKQVGAAANNTRVCVFDSHHHFLRILFNRHCVCAVETFSPQ